MADSREAGRTFLSKIERAAAHLGKDALSQAFPSSRPFERQSCFSGTHAVGFERTQSRGTYKGPVDACERPFDQQASNVDDLQAVQLRYSNSRVTSRVIPSYHTGPRVAHVPELRDIDLSTPTAQCQARRSVFLAKEKSGSPEVPKRGAPGPMWTHSERIDRSEAPRVRSTAALRLPPGQARMLRHARSSCSFVTVLPCPRIPVLRPAATFPTKFTISGSA